MRPPRRRRRLHRTVERWKPRTADSRTRRDGALAMRMGRGTKRGRRVRKLTQQVHSVRRVRWAASSGVWSSVAGGGSWGHCPPAIYAMKAIGLVWETSETKHLRVAWPILILRGRRQRGCEGEAVCMFQSTRPSDTTHMRSCTPGGGRGGPFSLSAVTPCPLTFLTFLTFVLCPLRRSLNLPTGGTEDRGGRTGTGRLVGIVGGGSHRQRGQSEAGTAPSPAGDPDTDIPGCLARDGVDLRS